MSIEIYDYTLPKNIVLPEPTELLILPWYSAEENKIQGKAVYPESTSTVIKLLKQNAIEVQLAEGRLSDILLEDRH